MTTAGTIVFVSVILWVLYRLQRDLGSGLRTVVGLLVFLPVTLRVSLPEPLPQVTIHRIILIIAFGFLICNRNTNLQKCPIPNLRLVVLFGLAQVVSLLCGIDFVGGIKGCVGYAFETVLLYYVISQFIQNDFEFEKMLSSVCYGLAGVAAVAIVQKYFGTGAAGPLIPTSANSVHPTDERGLAATYTMRIMLGYGMAMGIPLSLALAAYFTKRKARLTMWGISILLIVAAYFSASRGPWLSVALALLGLTMLGGRSIARLVAMIAVLTALVLFFRPGVRDTISNLCGATFDQDTVYGGSYEYRWQLWSVAWDQISRSPVRFCFGYGSGSTEHMDLSRYWYGEEGGSAGMLLLGHTSWDNNYACDLIELGVFGFLVRVWLFYCIVRRLFDNLRGTDPGNRVLQAGVVVACLVFMFAMTNVFIFAPQLDYLFWALVAVGSNFARVSGGEFGGRNAKRQRTKWTAPGILVEGEVPV